MEAVDALFPNATLVDPAAAYGNTLAASAPLAVHLTIEAAAHGSWPPEPLQPGDGTFRPGPILVLSCGLMSGCAALVVETYGRG